MIATDSVYAMWRVTGAKPLRNNGFDDHGCRVSAERRRVFGVATINGIADSYVDAWAAAHPIGATFVGVGDHDDRLDDLSPDGFAAQADLAQRTTSELNTTESRNDHEQGVADGMLEQLDLEIQLYDSGITMSDINTITGPLHDIRSVFDLMPTSGEQSLTNIAARLQAVRTALRQYRQTLHEAASHGNVSAHAQISAVANQCDSWVDPQRDNVFHSLVEKVKAGGRLDNHLRNGAESATTAVADFARFLREELAPLGRENQAVGRDRYSLASRYFLGAEVDLDDTYAWGFAELARIETEMRAAARDIAGFGATVDEAVAILDADPNRKVVGKEAFRDWMQSLADRAIEGLHGVHFDIPEPARRIECCLAPTSDGSIYYTAPSEDFTRPGRMWWAVPSGDTTFATWREATTVYHEGVPGHHLQSAQTLLSADRLNRWQRLLAWCSGYGEGWALYAERLMAELGYLDDPGERLGMLDAQAMRAARVIVDIGMHLELRIPQDNEFKFYPGQQWTPELGWLFMRAHCRISDLALRSEIDRYLGWPGQAPSYKIGERIWMQARDDVQARQGAAFDLKTFHHNALNLGPLGLAPLRKAISRL